MERIDAEDFLYREAQLLDAGDWAAWFDLWEPSGEIEYWVPASRRACAPMVEPSHIYDDRGNLRLRVERLEQAWPLSQDPPAATIRSVHNVRVTPGIASVHVDSVFRITELRRGERIDWVGAAEHALVRGEGGERIRSKKVTLIDADRPIPALAVIL